MLEEFIVERSECIDRLNFACRKSRRILKTALRNGVKEQYKKFLRTDGPTSIEQTAQIAAMGTFIDENLNDATFRYLFGKNVLWNTLMVAAICAYDQTIDEMRKGS